MAERVGFEPTGAKHAAGFQDRFLQPLGHLSTEAPFPSLLNALLFYHTPYGFVNTFRREIFIFSDCNHAGKRI